MDNLLFEYQQKLRYINRDFERYLLPRIDLNNRLIVVKGARGAGKTTLLLQLAKYYLNTQNALYISLDHIYFYDNSLYDLAKSFDLLGGKHLLLDEVHKYPNWSREIKLIYDNFPNLQIIFTSSSLLQIYQSESDLSRRAISYQLKELSLREFIALDSKIELPAFQLKEILYNHVEIANEILNKIKPYGFFVEYLKTGAYPYFTENKSFYLQKLTNTINLVIEVDINAVENLNFETLINLKKLLMSIASSVPFTPNISKLSEKIGISRNHLLHSIKILERANLINELYKDNKGIGVLTKPEKLYLNNTNLLFALANQNTNIGNLRETFFVNQLKDLHLINLSDQADYLVDKKYTFEVGGKNKSQKQISGIADAYLVKDAIEIGFGNQIPLWLFGFLY